MALLYETKFLYSNLILNSLIHSFIVFVWNILHNVDPYKNSISLLLLKIISNFTGSNLNTYLDKQQYVLHK